MKFQRQTKILEIVKDNHVETQEDLSALLHVAGFSTTQATISRDIKELRLVKVLTDGGSYRYTIAGSAGEPLFSGRLRTIFRESVTSCDCAQNIVVIKTLPGLAPAACSAVDSMNIAALVGTLAGDDTGMLVLRTNEDAVELVELLHSLLK